MSVETVGPSTRETVGELKRRWAAGQQRLSGAFEDKEEGEVGQG
jgi:hypothetical protein